MNVERAIVSSILTDLDNLRPKAYDLNYMDMYDDVSKTALALIQGGKLPKWEIAMRLIDKFGQETFDCFMDGAVPDFELDGLIKRYQLSLAREKVKQEVIDIEGMIDRGDDLEAIRDRLSRAQALTNLRSSEYRNMEDITKSVADDVFDIVENGTKAIDLPLIGDLLEYILGGELIIIAGRPSMGKTAFMLSMARTLAEKGVKTGFVSLEMSSKGLALRLAQNELDFSILSALKTLQKDSEKYNRILQALDVVKRLNLYISDKGTQTLGHMLGTLEKMVRTNGVRVIFVDYLQLVSSPGNDSRNNEVAAISRALKLFAMETNTVVFAGSQLSRAVEQRENRRPRLSDLRDSGAIEQDADVVSFLYREYYYDRGADPYDTEFIVAKQRNGVVGSKHLYFDLGRQRFLEYTNEKS